VQTSTAPPQMAKQMAKRTGPTIAEEAAAKEAAAEEEEEEEEEDEEVAKAAEAEVAAEAAVAAAAAAEAAEEEAAEAAADLAVAEAAAVQADAEAAEAVEAAEAEAAEAEAEAAEAATAEAAGAEAAEAEVVAEAEAAAAAALRYAKAVPPTPGIVLSDMVEEVVAEEGKTNKPSWTSTLQIPAPEEDSAHVLGPRGELHDFKAQAKELYKYESKLTGYSVSKEEEWAKDSPGYYTLQTSGGNQLDRASGGPRFGIPIQEFHWKDERADGAQVVGRVPPVDESPFEVSVCPLRTVLTCSQPDLRAFLVIGV
jgi:hypothetical protein